MNMPSMVPRKSTDEDMTCAEGGAMAAPGGMGNDAAAMIEVSVQVERMEQGSQAGAPPDLTPGSSEFPRIRFPDLLLAS